MAITSAQRTELLELTTLMFNAAPGAAYLSDIVDIYEASGMNLDATAAALGSTDVYQGLFYNTLTASEFAAKFLTPLGLENDAVALDFISSKYGVLSDAEIVMAAYYALKNASGAQYVAAWQTIENKAKVAEYYSVTLGESSSDLATLEKVLSNVTSSSDVSSSAAIETLLGQTVSGQTFNLTTDVDNIVPSSAHAFDVVKAVETDPGEGGTLNTGDVIQGNGHTVVELTLAANDGIVNDGKVAEISDVAAINVKTLSSGTIQAAGFSNVESINLTSGIDGKYVFVDNLEAGTTLTIANVTGSISASYDLGGGQVYASLANDDSGGDGGTLNLDADGNAVINMANSMHAEIYDINNVALGNIAVVGGDTTTFDLYLAGNDSQVVGDVSVSLGNSSSVSVSVDSASGDVTFGDISLTVGNSSTISLEAESVSGDLTFGDVSLVAGDTASVSVSITEVDGSATIGNLNIEAGVNATIDVSITTTANASGNGAITLGDFTVAMGDSSSLSATIEADNGDVTIGNVSVVGGNTATADIYISASSTKTTSNDLHSVVVGNVTVALGDGGASGTGYASVSIENNGNNVGDLTVGDVDMSAGNNNSVYFGAFNYANAATTASNTGTAAGNLTVGDVVLAAGDEVGVNTTTSDAFAQFYVYNEAWGTTGQMDGTVTVGDVSVTVGNGYVSGTQTNDAEAYVTINSWAYGGMGDVTVGNIAVAGGDFASLSVSLSGYAVDSGAEVGNVTVGNVGFVGGESAYVNLTAEWYVEGTGTIGDLTFGNIDVAVKQDSVVSLDAYQYITANTDSNAIGNLTVGNVGVVAGDNSHVDIEFTQSASFNSGTGGSIGDLTVGDISVAVSATTTDALSGGSSINVNVSKTHWYADSLTGGNLTVGNVDLAAGNTGDVNFYVGFEGSYAVMGDLTVGDLNLSVGDDSHVNADLYVSNDDTGEVGAITVGNVSVQVGDNSQGSVTLDINSYGNGNMGAVTVGDVSLVAGNTSDLTFSLTYSKDDYTGDLASLSLGNVVMDGGDSTYLQYVVNITDNSATNDIGDVTLGNLTVTLGESSTADYTVSITDVGDTAGNIGHVTLGNISGTVGFGSTFNAYASFTATSDVAGADVGSISLDVAESGSANVEVWVQGGYNAGDVTVGDVSIMLADTNTATTDTAAASANVSLSLSSTNSADTLTVGNIDVSVAGDLAGDEAFIYLANNTGDIAIGNVTVSGVGVFILDGAAHTTATTDNTSFLSVSAGGDVSIGNVDFSGYENDAVIDLSFTTSGAASIIGSGNDDIIVANDDDNVITGGDGQDDITLGAGDDTIVTSLGDSGVTAPTIDVIVGWGSTDKLDFNTVAATAANYVEGTGSADLANFVTNANNSLNSTVKFYVDTFGGNTYVAVNTTSGDCEMIIELVGNQMANIGYANIIA